VNKLLENIIKDRFQLTTVKIERMCSSAHYEEILDLAYEQRW
jgi:hypothetical protein